MKPVVARHGGTQCLHLLLAARGRPGKAEPNFNSPYEYGWNGYRESTLLAGLGRVILNALSRYEYRTTSTWPLALTGTA